MNRYKTPSLEKLYRSLLEQAADPTSELNQGPKQPGQYTSEIQKVFWETVVGNTLHYVVPNTLLSVAVAAGKTWKKNNGHNKIN
jgi:hypothetical protein